MHKTTITYSLLLLVVFIGVTQSLSAKTIHPAVITGINTTETIPIGGIKQYISLRGDDITKPILLFLHGGPGGSLMDLSNSISRQLREHFIVVQWDQRQTGRTLQQNSSPLPLTINQFQEDTREMIGYLLKKFEQKKIFLAGYSWGNVMGFHIAEKYPQLLHAYIAISPVINQLESERITLAMLKQKAEKEGNEKEIQELSLVKIPFENGKQLFYSRKWLFAFDGQPMRNSDTASLINYFTQWSATWLPVWNESLNRNLIKELPVINCPVYFFVGKKDYQTHFSIAEQYYLQLTAPRKTLFWFDKSAHRIPNTEPALLQEIIINKILPETL
jgi:pimeloyl-ACP methyl ester carboxylesterase